MKIVLGTVGESGAGKETFAKTLKRISSYSVTMLVFSDILRDIIDFDWPNNGWGIYTWSRGDLQRLRVKINEKAGEEFLPKVMCGWAMEARSDIVIIDGVRWISDEALIRRFSNNLLVYITASQRIRFERLKERQRSGEGQEMSWGDFLERSSAQAESFISEIGSRADVTIENNGTPEEFTQKVESFYQTILCPRLA